MVIKIKEFKYNFKIYNLGDNNMVEIYYYNYNFFKIKLKISEIISLDNNNIKYLDDKEKDFNTKELKKIKKLNSFFIILIKIFDKFCINIRKKIKNNY